MIRIPNEDVACFKDPDCKVRLMRKYGHCAPFIGTNAEGEKVILSIAPDSIVLETYQSNGWIRKNYYDGNGFPDGEMYDGKWHKPDPEEENTVWLVVENCYEDGVVHVTTFRTHEAASAEFQRIKSKFEDNEISESTAGSGEYFHAFGLMYCEVKRSVIRDA